MILGFPFLILIAVFLKFGNRRFIRLIFKKLYVYLNLLKTKNWNAGEGLDK